MLQKKVQHELVCQIIKIVSVTKMELRIALLELHQKEFGIIDLVCDVLVN